jgi:hypothetical protein
MGHVLLLLKPVPPQRGAGTRRFVSLLFAAHHHDADQLSRADHNEHVGHRMPDFDKLAGDILDRASTMGGRLHENLMELTRAALIAVYNEALEDAASTCERIARGDEQAMFTHVGCAEEVCAAAIRKKITMNT